MADFASALWNKPASAGGGGSEAHDGASDPVTRSLRFESGATHRLTKTFGSAPTSSKVSTLAFWVKRSKLGSNQHIISANGTSHSENTNSFYVQFKTDDALRVSSYPDPQTNVFTLTTSRKFRDVNAWTHIAILINTDESAAADRCKIYINGVQEPSANLSGTNPSSGATNHLLGKATTTWYGSGNVNVQHCIGDEADRFRYKYSGYLADFYFVDGSAVEPDTNFIESTGYGSYKPKAFDMSSYSGNSFHLKFEDSSDIGSDSTSNSNDFSTTGISSHDVLLDTPTKNYATLNPLQKAGSNGSDPSEGNLSLVGGSNPSKAFSSTIAANSGKYYAEFYLESLGYPSVSVSDTSLWVNNYGSGRVEGNGSITYDIRAATGSGDYFINATSGSGALSLEPSSGDIIQVAFDADTRKVWFGRNGTWNGSGDPANGTNNVGVVGGTDALTVVLRSESGTTIAGFGADPTFEGNETSGQDTSQSEFYYAPPTGFKSLNASNLTAPIKPEENFNTVLYNGTYESSMGSGTSSQSITGVGFSPDICWIKDRDNQAGNSNSYYGHYWFDTVLGTGSAINIDAEQGLSGSLNSGEDGISSFDSDGFTVDEAEETNYSADTDYDYEPDTPERYVAWCWKLGTTASSWSGSGQDPDSEQYNSDAGMSIIDYTDGGSGSSVTLNHSLGAAPEFAMALDYAGMAGSHYAWHKDLTAGNYLDLTSTGSQTSDSTYFPSGAATNTTFEVGSSLADSMQSHVALFRSVEGFSKAFALDTSSSAFCYLGFCPAWVILKRKDSTGDWLIFDDKREGYNVDNDALKAHSSTSESSTDYLDLLSNGFRVRSSNSSIGSGDLVGFAVASSPLKHANAR
tara:strand:+ start:176 stop:2746 length:2571 start_codon:yes stop_codon:yes gene_type:complete